MIEAKLIDWQPIDVMPEDRKDGRLLLLWSPLGGTQLGCWGEAGWESDLGYQQSDEDDKPAAFAREKFLGVAFWADINPPT